MSARVRGLSNNAWLERGAQSVIMQQHRGQPTVIEEIGRAMVGMAECKGSLASGQAVLPDETWRGCGCAQKNGARAGT